MFLDCNLKVAQFQKTTARGCFWRKSKFFDDANGLNPSKFDEADIRGSKDLTPEQLETVDLCTTKRDKHLACGQDFPEGNDDPY